MDQLHRANKSVVALHGIHHLQEILVDALWSSFTKEEMETQDGEVAYQRIARWWTEQEPEITNWLSYFQSPFSFSLCYILLQERLCFLHLTRLLFIQQTASQLQLKGCALVEERNSVQSKQPDRKNSSFIPKHSDFSEPKECPKKQFTMLFTINMDWGKRNWQSKKSMKVTDLITSSETHTSSDSMKRLHLPKPKSTNITILKH